jgi:hypothetical protein
MLSRAHGAVEDYDELIKQMPGFRTTTVSSTAGGGGGGGGESFLRVHWVAVPKALRARRVNRRRRGAG